MTREEQIYEEIGDGTFARPYNPLEVDENYRKGFKNGVKWADLYPNWIDINEKQPPLGVEVNAYNKEWINEDFNPNGTRVGFMTDNGFYSAFWWNYQDCYMTICKDDVESDSEFYKSHIGKTEPTHWMPIVPPKFD